MSASASGTVSETVTIPSGIEPGAHQIEVRGAASGSSSVDLTVSGTLAATGFDDATATIAGLGAGILLLGGASVMLWAQYIRRRRAA